MEFRKLFITALIVLAPLIAKSNWNPALNKLVLVEYWDTTDLQATPKLAYKIAHLQTATTFQVNNEGRRIHPKNFLGAELSLEKLDHHQFELTEYGQLILIGKNGKKQVLGQKGHPLLKGPQAKILTLQEQGDLVFPPYIVANHAWTFKLNQDFFSLDMDPKTYEVRGLLGSCKQTLKKL